VAPLAVAPRTSRVELAIGGMTCASCASRIERKLNKLAEVTATVNYATEQASVDFPGTFSAQDLVSTVQAAGYTATLSVPRDAVEATSASAVGGEPDTELSDPASALLYRVTVSAALALPPRRVHQPASPRRDHGARVVQEIRSFRKSAVLP